MAQKSELPLAPPLNLRLVRGDFEAMATLFPAMGASVAIRKLVHNYVKRVRASVAPLDIDLEATDLTELMS